MQPKGTVVDPRLSRRKFERELAEYRRRQHEYHERGWWILRAEFPTVFAVFPAAHLKPAPVTFGAVIDFTNYDLWPPSVRITHPFTGVPFRPNELPHPFPKLVHDPAVPNPTALPEATNLVQFFEGEETPFFCLPGVREYHDNPGHSGDSWLMHRGRGEGTLFFLLDKLHRYGVSTLQQQAQIQLRVLPVGAVY